MDRLSLRTLGAMFTGFSPAAWAAIKTTAISWLSFAAAVVLPLLQTEGVTWQQIAGALSVAILTNLAGLSNAATKPTTIEPPADPNAAPLVPRKAVEMMAEIVAGKASASAIHVPHPEATVALMAAELEATSGTLPSSIDRAAVASPADESDAG